MAKIQSTLVISKSKGLSEILRDICTSTYQICGDERKMNRTTTIKKWICNSTPEDRDILKLLWKRGKIAHVEQFLLFYTIFCYLLLDFHVKAARFSLGDQQLFEISDVEIKRADSTRIGSVSSRKKEHKKNYTVLKTEETFKTPK